jgi:hypothetical protein
MEQVLHRLDELELRVSKLELPEESHYRDCVTAERAESGSVQPAHSATALDSASIGGIFGAVAKAVLGLAGAYLLRAVTESGLLPHAAGVFAAFAYALTWIIVAGKITKRDRATSTIYALPSSIIFLGLLWERS